jgi:hypothetical protein
MLNKYYKMGLAAATCTLLGMSAANAAVTITFTESGGNVIATGVGTVNLVGLGSPNSPTFRASVAGGSGTQVFVGPTIEVPVTTYFGVGGPTNWGPGFFFDFASSGSGDLFGIAGNGDFSQLVVPAGYVSGSPLSGSAEWTSASFSSLALTPGSYVYTWGDGVTEDSLTVNIGAIPEPSGALLGCLGVLALLRRKRSI